MPLACHGGTALGWERRRLGWERRTVVRAACHVWRWRWLCEIGRRRLAAGYDEGPCPRSADVHLASHTQFKHLFVLCARPNPRQRAVRSGAASWGWLGYPTRGPEAANGLLTRVPAHWGAF